MSSVITTYSNAGIIGDIVDKVVDTVDKVVDKVTGGGDSGGVRPSSPTAR